jgi:uncharacterized membrane protein YvbJ
MQYCKECGRKLKEGAQFCNDCGAKIGSNTPNQPASTSSMPTSPKKPMSKKQKLSFIIAGVAVVLLFGLYKLGESLTSNERLITKFEEAVLENDEKALAKVLSSNNKKLVIDEKSVKGLINYYKKNPEIADETFDSLKRQANILDAAEKAKQTDSDDLLEDVLLSGYFVNLEKDGKTFIYDRYQINIDPVYLSLGTNFKDTELYIDGKKVGKANKPEFEATYGPYVPGLHKVEAKLKTDFIDLTTNETILFAQTEGKQQEGIYLEADQVTVDIPEELADQKVALYINGKDVGVNLSESPTFGPVLMDGTMKMAVEAEFPWGKVKSEEVAIEDDYITPSFISKEMKESFMNSFHNYFTEWADAYSSLDPAKLTTTTPSLAQEIVSEATEEKEYGYGIQAKHTASYFNPEIDLEFYDDKWTAYVEAKINREYDYYYEDETPELEEMEDYYQAQFSYDSKAGKWLIENVESSWGFDEESAIEMLVKEPKLFTSGQAAVTTSSAVSASTDVPDYINELMDGYLNGLVSAINSKDFSKVSSYMLKDGDFYNTQKDLVKRLGDKGITEELVDYKITDVNIEGGSGTITTWEKVTINYSDGTSETKEYNWVYSGEANDADEFLLVNMQAK